MGLFQRIRRLCLIALVAACNRQPPPADGPHSQAPELTGGFTWLNSPAVTLAALRGQAVVLHFFDCNCAHSLRTVRFVKKWNEQYHKHGLVVVGVHVPQFEFAMHPTTVHWGVQRLGLRYPVVVDSHYTIADAYLSRAVPRLCLIDATGMIRFDRTGEGVCAEAEPVLQQLLHVKQTPPIPAPSGPNPPVTPDLFLGRDRGQVARAEPGARLPAEQVYVIGQWEHQAEYVRHARDVEELADGVAVNYRGAGANVVMKPEGIYWKQVYVQEDGGWLRREIAGADIKFDDHGRSFVEVRHPQLYQLTTNEPAGLHELRLFIQGQGLSVYQFSFDAWEQPR